MTGSRGRRRKQLLDDLMKTSGYWKLKEETLRLAVLRTHFGRVNGTLLFLVVYIFGIPKLALLYAPTT